jgi:hypothetical protein
MNLKAGGRNLKGIDKKAYRTDTKARGEIHTIKKLLWTSSPALTFDRSLILLSRVIDIRSKTHKSAESRRGKVNNNRCLTSAVGRLFRGQDCFGGRYNNFASPVRFFSSALVKVREQDDCTCKEKSEIADVVPKLEYQVMNHGVVIGWRGCQSARSRI